LDWLLSDPGFCLWLADYVVALHFVVVVFALGGAIAILLGGFRSWEWVRRPVFRFIHLGVVAAVALQQELCFLTDWEIALRERAGKGVEEASFVGRLLHEWLFVDVELATLQKIYIAFGLLVLLGLFTVRPCLRRQR